MRSAAQRVVRVATVARESAAFETFDPETGEVVVIDAARGVQRHRLGQKICGRATGMDLPERGAQLGSGQRPERAGAVELVQRADGRVTLRNVYRCGSVWCCPVCSYAVAQERGEEVQRVFEELRGRGKVAYLITLTARHWAGMDLRALRSAVSDAVRKLRAQRWWRDATAELGYLGDVRALEVTHGPNGWHPHVHMLAWVSRAVTPRAAAVFRSRLRAWWCDEMERRTGARPTRKHGVHVQRVHHRADYVTKLGIAAELTSPVTKEGRRAGHRSVWEILRDLTDRGSDADAELWRQWTEGIHGARQLTWSGKELKAVRGELGIEDESDEALAAREAERGEVVATVPADTFTRLYKELPGFSPWLMDSAERYGGAGVVELVLTIDRELFETGKPPEWWRGWGGPAGPATFDQT
jgi:hypothetical protein